MKRKMIGAAGAYMSGLFFASFFSGKIALLLLIFQAAVLFLLRGSGRVSAADIVMMWVMFGAAFGVSCIYTALCVEPVRAYSGCTGDFSGKITEYDTYSEDIGVYVLKGKIDGSRYAKIRLVTRELDAEHGDIVELRGCTFEAIEGDYLFDTASYNSAEHVYLQVKKAPDVSVTKRDAMRVRRSIAKFRQKMISRVMLCAGAEEGSFLCGMLFGEKQYIEDQTKNDLNRAGIGHLLCVSGLHISIVAALIITLTKRLGMKRLARFICMDAFLGLLMLLAEHPVSAIRASIMFNIICLAELTGQQHDTFNSLAAAVFLICLADPYSVYSSGLMLSIAGTAGAAVFSVYMTKDIDKSTFFGGLKVVLSAAVFTNLVILPVELYYFDSISVFAPLFNVVAIPLCTVAMVSGAAFLLTFGKLKMLLLPAKLCARFILGIPRIFGDMPSMDIPVPSENIPLIMAISGTAVILVYAFGGSRKAVTRALAVCTAVCSLAIFAANLSYSCRTVVTLLGKGTNYAAVIASHGHAVVVDISGHYKSPDYAAKYIRRRNLRVDAVVLLKKTQAQWVTYEHRLPNTDSDTQFIFREAVLDTESYVLTADADGMCVRLAEYPGAEICADAKNGLILRFADGEAEIGCENDFELRLNGDGYEVTPLKK